MKEKITKLRIKIDGLSQLVKGLKPLEQFRVNINSVPDNMTLEDFVSIWKQSGMVIENAPDGITPLAQHFKELEKSYNSLILAKAWLGKVLGELGQETPYKNDGKRKSVDDIEETADVELVSSGQAYMKLSHIEKVDWLREEIKEIHDEFNLLSFTLQFKNLVKEPWLTMIPNTSGHLSEARFWLGFELQRIKEDN